MLYSAIRSNPVTGREVPAPSRASAHPFPGLPPDAGCPEQQGPAVPEAEPEPGGGAGSGRAVSLSLSLWCRGPSPAPRPENRGNPSGRSGGGCLGTAGSRRGSAGAELSGEPRAQVGPGGAPAGLGMRDSGFGCLHHPGTSSASSAGAALGAGRGSGRALSQPELSPERLPFFFLARTSPARGSWRGVLGAFSGPESASPLAPTRGMRGR